MMSFLVLQETEERLMRHIVISIQDLDGESWLLLYIGC